jgi:hypothetical protein
MKKTALSLILGTALVITAQGNRAIQMREVNFETGVIELHNFGTTEQALDGWRFCSHDENQLRRYSTSSGLNDLTIAAGESLFIHFFGDPPADDSNAIGIAGRGNFAAPLDRGPYAIQLYNGRGFSNGNNIIDHLQWSIDGADNISADERSDEAQSGGVWTNQSLWIATTAESETITLTDDTGGILHSPENYSVTEPALFPETLEITAITATSDGTVTLAWEDLGAFGDINYTIETSPDLSEESWVPALANPVQTTSVNLTDQPAGPRFYRVLAEVSS